MTVASHQLATRGITVRIALLSPLYESVPPQKYGGTERVVSWLADELVRRGHHVTLFASGDSRTRAELVPVVDRALRLGHRGLLLDSYALHLAAAARVRARAHDFDVIHSSIDYLAFPAFRDAPVPFVTTMHGRLDIAGLTEVHGAYPLPVVSISDAQRAALPDAAWVATVYHGLPIEPGPVGPGGGDYVVFLGRISPEKAPDAAIRAARRAGVRLVIAAKIDPADRAYHDEVIAPLLRAGDGVEFIGEVDDAQKVALLRDARALLFPICWPEPFGLVMIEAMACGTPVIARRSGSVPEIVDHGRTGLICDDEDQLVAALHAIDRLDRAACRRAVEQRFSVARMTSDYETLYHDLAERRRFPGAARGVVSRAGVT